MICSVVDMPRARSGSGQRISAARSTDDRNSRRPTAKMPPLCRISSSFGLSGTAEAPFNVGRTATHEVGHYLNLIHIWADTNGCTGSDMVADTPNCAGPNFGTPSWPSISCNNGPNGDMFMNYMDYTDDAAMFMFTAQQVVRMRTALESARPGLLQAL